MVSVVALPTTMKWVKPAPLWELQGTDMAKPLLVEFDNDRFLPYFLDLIGGKVAGKTPANLGDYLVAHTNGIAKLYQPLHGHYYLITGSLVCRQLGLPDRTVVRKNGEKVSFVLRRLKKQSPDAPYIEAAWVDDGPNKGWQPLIDAQNKPVVLRKDEERLPLHPAKAINTPSAGTSVRSNGTQPSSCTACMRTIYHGYIPVDSREKYLLPATDAAQKIQDLIDHSQSGDSQVDDPRLDELTTRVTEAWRTMYASSVKPTPDVQRQISLNVIVDLGDFLKKNLPGVYAAIVSGTTLPSGQTKRQALLAELQNITLNEPANPQLTLTEAIKKLSDSANLLRAEEICPEDTCPQPITSQDIYDLAQAKISNKGTVDNNYLASPPLPAGTFYSRFRDALDEEKADHPDAWLKVPAEIGNMIKDEPADGYLYWLRLVYEHDPCDPVLSDPCDPFRFAKVFDPDAPARNIRVELPSMKLTDLRKYKRGIGMRMSSQLGDVVNKVKADPGRLLQGKGLPNTGTPSGIGMICSFSIPIITLCALIVLFIFLVLLNIIFWWLPFVRVCFPVPQSK